MSAKLFISKTFIVVIFFYYFLIFLFGNCLAIISLAPNLIFESQIEILLRSLIGSPGMACIGSSIFYIRKIYKSCIQQKFIIDEVDNYRILRFGTMIYYLARPLFAIGFSILIVIGIKSGSMLTSKSTIILDDGFLYLTMFFSFFVGFSTGQFIKSLEAKSNKIMEKI